MQEGKCVVRMMEGMGYLFLNKGGIYVLGRVHTESNCQRHATQTVVPLSEQMGFNVFVHTEKTKRKWQHN